MIYFHGSPKKNLKSILENGLQVEYGRATLTTNPLMCLNYGEVRFSQDNLESAMLLVIDDKEAKVHLANNSDISIDAQEKTVKGWVNRYKNEQFGYFGDGSIAPESIVAVFSFSSQMLNILKGIKDAVKLGTVNQRIIESCINALSRQLSKTELQLVAPKIQISDISQSMILGLVRNIALLEIRQNKLSSLLLDGYEIDNLGDHEVALKHTKEEVNQSGENIQNFINSDFIDPDVCKEYYKEK